MISVESLYLTALLSAFVGLIALLALSRPRAKHAATNFLGQLIIVATVVSVGSFLVYSFSPHHAARAVYGAVSAAVLPI
ncbi:MAG: hypothetical protein ACR652_02325 [Methylocystis sp.]|uniref:hypothetical protein n=1 Tax=Methylocystis sp. TaxID=1911079 RepID=UPI003DA4150B